MWVDVVENEKKDYNSLVTHPLQSFEWGDFREKTGVKVIRRGYRLNGKLTQAFSLTIHKVPRTRFTIGYLPKGDFPSKEVLEELTRIGKEEKCIFIQLEPNVIKNQEKENQEFDSLIHNSLFIIRKSFHPLFTKFTFVLNISKNEEDILKNFHPKTRYNIRVAQKHDVKVIEDNSADAFKKYLQLTRETTTRQKFYAHTPDYHKTMWETLKSQTEKSLSAHLLTAKYHNETLASWILFVFHDYLYYPYGASSSKYRNVMASNLIMWEAIKFGKKLGLKYFDMWGALESPPNVNDSWYGFHKFKEGYGAKHTEFIGSYDLIINPVLYQPYKVTDKIRWTYLRLKKFI